MRPHLPPSCSDCESSKRTQKSNDGKLSAGTAYGIPVDLMWWLYGPFGGKAGWAILRTGAP
jgi:hypothetical protein